MSSVELTAYYRKLGLQRLEDMNETEKMMAKKKLQDFIDNKNNVNVNTSRSKQNSTTLKAGGIRKRGFGAAIANKNRYAPSSQDNSAGIRRQ